MLECSQRVHNAVLRMLGREDEAILPKKKTKKAVLQPRNTAIKRKTTKNESEDEDDAILKDADESDEHVQKMSVAELKAELRKRAQKVGGRKEELVRRLKDALAREREWTNERTQRQPEELLEEQVDQTAEGGESEVPVQESAQDDEGEQATEVKLEETPPLSSKKPKRIIIIP